MGTLGHDLRYAWRMLSRSPGFTAVAVISLALGIGANTSIFSLANALLFRPLPVHEPDRLVELYTSDSSGPLYGGTCYPDYIDLRDRNRVFSALMAHSVIPMSMASGDATERIFGEIVTGNYFDLLGVPAALGRTFRPEEDGAPGAHPVAVASHGFWKRRFGADPGLVGRTLELNGHPFTVIGVAPESFRGTVTGLAPDLWVPLAMQAQAKPGNDDLVQRGCRWLFVMGRLEPGVGIGQAQAQIAALATQLGEEHPETNAGRLMTLVPRAKAGVHPRINGLLAGALALLFAVVGLVLLLACANLANLLLARASGRRREIATRLALGASRGRLVRQLLTESLLLGLLGGAAGLLVALWTTELLVAFRPPIPIPIALDLGLDGRVLGFTLILSVVTGIVFGVAPALAAARPDLVPALRDEPVVAGARRGRVRRRLSLRNLLVAGQVALSLLLLIGAGLFLRGLGRAEAIDPGFETRNVLVMSVDLKLHGYPEAEGKRFYRDLVERVEALPGVRAASLAEVVPLGFQSQSWGVVIEGHEPSPGEGGHLEIDANIVTPRYFATLGIPLRRGRDFTPEDGPEAPLVCIVNETLARRFWPGEEAMGKRLGFNGPEGPMAEVVGVAADLKVRSLGEEPRPFFWVPFTQTYESEMTLHVRTAGDPRALLPAVRREVAAIDPHLPVIGATTLDEHMGISLFPARMAAGVLGVFGLVALGLAAIGLAGVMGFAVSRRTREIGIRMAVGAEPAQVLRLVVGEGMGLALAGMACGLAAALLLTRLVASLLYGLSPADPATYAGTSLLLLAVALAASWLPARRATRIDPVAALRCG